ncbi:MAG: hypothetical protein JRE43_08170 [Deltaproteobacteria bacterium]|nr:hypothetical protein [Deltaproteobacteria bacterium]MBW2543192.1 hypothetical protein [Deltaproteobacteria bacterium]
MKQLPGRAMRRLFRPASARITRLLFNWARRDRERFVRQLFFDTIVGFVDDCRIEGDYLEFGCAQGSSLIDMFDSMRPYPRQQTTRFLIFDSFEGLPEPTGHDAGVHRRYEGGQFACDIDQYERNVRAGGVDMQRVKLIPGWYDQSLNESLKRELAIDKASIVLIDCDLYESTVPVLDFITSYIQDGTVLIFDDWFSYKGRLDQGEAKAFGEWLDAHPSIRATEYQKSGRTMISFIMHVDDESTPARSDPPVVTSGGERFRHQS